MFSLAVVMYVKLHEPVHVAPIPEPGTVGLMVVAGVGLVIVGLMKRGKGGDRQ